MSLEAITRRRFRRFGQQSADHAPERAQRFEVAGADGDGDELKSGAQHLQEGKLHFQRVLETMAASIFA